MKGKHSTKGASSGKRGGSAPHATSAPKHPLNSPPGRAASDRPSIKTATGTTTKSMKPGVRSRGA